MAASFLARAQLRKILIYFAAVASAAATTRAVRGLQVEHVASAVTDVDEPADESAPPRTDKRWAQRDLVVHVDASLEALDPEAPAAVGESFQTWLAASPEIPAVHLEPIAGADPSSGPDGLNTVTHGPIAIAGHEHDLAITVTYRDAQSGELREADIVLNSRYPWAALDAGSTDCGGCFDLGSVLTHEVGHFLGLRDETEQTWSTMYFVTHECETHKRSLTPQDTAHARELYLGSEIEAEGDSWEIQCTTAAPGSNARSTRQRPYALLPLLALAACSRRRRRGAARRSRL